MLSVVEPTLLQGKLADWKKYNIKLNIEQLQIIF